MRTISKKVGVLVVTMDGATFYGNIEGNGDLVVNVTIQVYVDTHTLFRRHMACRLQNFHIAATQTAKCLLFNVRVSHKRWVISTQKPQNTINLIFITRRPPVVL